MFIENQQKGNYKVHLDPGDYCDLIIKFNLNYDADPEIGKILAASLGIAFDELMAVGRRPDEPDDIHARQGGVTE